MEAYPNLKAIADKDMVETIGSGFKAEYINWSNTMQMLRDNAPGWLPAMELDKEGSPLWQGPVGAFLMIYFQKGDQKTTSWPQAVMDNRNKSIPFDKVTSRDITDTHRRGTCAAAAGLFGLCYELWAKMPLESGYEMAQKAEAKEVAEAKKIRNAALKKRGDALKLPMSNAGWTTTDFEALRNYITFALPPGEKGNTDMILDSLEVFGNRWAAIRENAEANEIDVEGSKNALGAALKDTNLNYNDAFTILENELGIEA